MPTVTKPCEECGSPFEAKTKRAKFCTTNCRVRANRRPSKTGAAVQAAGEETPAADRAPARGGLVGQVAADLAKAAVIDTIPGRAALALAYRIESPMESGAAAAAMTRELSRLVDAAMLMTPKQNDQVDQLGDSVGAKLQLVR